MDNIILSINTSLYLLLLLSITRNILEYKKLRKFYIVLDVLVITLLFIFSFILTNTEFTFLCIFAHTIQILLIYASVKELKMFTLVSMYICIYFINSLLTVVLNSFLALSITYMTVLELIVHFFFAIIIVICCFNKNICYKIQKTIFLIPLGIKVLVIFSFCISAFLLALILSNPETHSSSFWSISVRIVIVLFALFLCTTFPILIITVLTNTYLKKQNENFERELQAQAEHYIALAESNKELRRFKHDFKNLRIGIAKALSSGDNEIALEMIENGQNDFIQATDNILKFNTGNGIVDAILTEKQKKAASYNTNIVFEGMIPQTGFAPTDLCVIFGNTLDNAIEACEKISNSDDNIISLSVNCSSGFVFISITNPVAEKVVTYKNHIETTKKDRAAHGFGLYSLRKIADKYDGEMNIASEEHTFTLTLELCL